MQRGKLRNKAFATIPTDFSGVRFGNITPMDIDAFIEYKNNCFVVVEIKHLNKALDYGAGLALTRLVDCLSLNKSALLIHCTWHQLTDDCINLEYCVVARYYYLGEWRQLKTPMNCRQLIERFLFSKKKKLSPHLRAV